MSAADTAADYDFSIKQGATFRKTFTYTDSDDAPIDLTGYTAKMQARKHYDDPLPLIDLTTENDGIEITEVDGKVTLVMSDDDTAALNFDKARYDLYLVNGAGESEPFLEGEITLRRSNIV